MVQKVGERWIQKSKYTDLRIGGHRLFFNIIQR